MERPRSRFLTHPYPTFHGCSIREVILLSVGVIIALLVLTMIAGCFIGHFLLLLSGVFVLTPLSVKWIAKKLARYKRGKPYNFVLMSVYRRLGWGALTGRICRDGVWDTRRRLPPSEEEA